MSVFNEIIGLEKEIEGHSYDFDGKIANIRKFLLSDNENHLSSIEAKTLAIRIWDITIKLKKLFPDVNELDKSQLRKSKIPELKILATNIYQKYSDLKDEIDLNNLFYFYSYAYESLLDSDNISLASNYLDKAFEIFHQLRPTSKINQILIQLKVWQAQYLILHDNNYDEALVTLKEFADHYIIDYPLFLSFIYKTTVETKSIDWCNFCLSLSYKNATISNEWKNQIESLQAQLYINNHEPEKAMKIVSILPNSINRLFLEIKCTILLSPKEEDLKEKMISFISKTANDRRILLALCLFVADHCESIEKVSILFISEVMKISHTISDNFLRNHFYISAIQISSNLNDIKSSSLFLKTINNDDYLIDECRNESAEILWKKAIHSFDTNQFEKAIEWMQLSRSQMDNFDNQAQSISFRFISCCFFEDKNYHEALKYVNYAIEKDSICSYNYLLKFHIQIAAENQKEAFESVEQIMKDSVYLGEFEPDFFFLFSSELHSIGNDKLALEVLLKFFELNFNAHQNPESCIKKKTINSIFSLMQEIDEQDDDYVSKSIKKLSSQWKNQIQYKIVDKELDKNDETDDSFLYLTSNEIHSFISVSFNNGLKQKEKNLFENAIDSFMFGFILSDSFIESKVSCLFEAIDCVFMKKTVSNDSSDSQLVYFTNELDQISDEIENLEERIKDELFIAKLKASILEMNQTESEKDQSIKNIIHLIDEIKTPYALHDACDIVCKSKISDLFIRTLLDHAKKIDQTSGEFSKKDEISPIPIFPSLLHQFYMNCTTLDDASKFYDIMIDFIKNNSFLMLNSIHLQFFMSHAWNFGVKCVESFQLNKAEWWFKKAIEIMEMNEELKNLYSNELNQGYSSFVTYKNASKILLSI